MNSQFTVDNSGHSKQLTPRNDHPDQDNGQNKQVWAAAVSRALSISSRLPRAGFVRLAAEKVDGGAGGLGGDSRVCPGSCHM